MARWIEMAVSDEEEEEEGCSLSLAAGQRRWSRLCKGQSCAPADSGGLFRSDRLLLPLQQVAAWTSEDAN